MKTVFNDRFLKIKTFIVMGITLGHKYRWHATTKVYLVITVIPVMAMKIYITCVRCSWFKCYIAFRVLSVWKYIGNTL